MEKTAIPENRRGESFDIKVTKSEKKSEKNIDKYLTKMLEWYY